MPVTQAQLADPRVIQRMSRMQMKAQQVMEGVISGMHKSPYHGFSVEFKQHREYSPGDEIRHIDWKAFGRSDRFDIMEFEEETNLKAHVIVDGSKSMEYKGDRRQMSKLEHGCVLAAAITSLLLQQRDQVGLTIFDEGIRNYVPPRSIASQFTLILEQLCSIDPKPKSDVASTLHEMAERLKRRGMVFLISDLFSDPREILMGLRHFRHRKHEVLVIQILDDDEITFPFTDLTKFEGLELEPEVLADPRGIQEEYLAQFNAFQAEMERGLRELQIDLLRINTKEEEAKPGEALATHLSMRARRR